MRGVIASLRRSNPRWRDVADTDPQLLHQVRVTLGERSRAQGAPARNINDVVQQLTDAMDDAGATGYRQAVNEFRSNSAIIDAFDEGRKAINALPETVEAFLSDATEGEATAYVAGLGRESLRRLSTGETGTASQAVRSLLRGERAQVMREALGPEAYNAFRNRLLRELRFAQTQGRVLGGSPTQPRQAGAAEQFRRLERASRAGQRLREGSVLGAGAELLTAAERSGPRVAEERALAQLLFRSQGQGLPAGRFQAPTPLLELAERQRLLGGAGALTSPLRGAARGGAGSGGGGAASALLGLAGF